MALDALPGVCNCDGSLAAGFYNTNPVCSGSPVWVAHLDTKGDLNFNNAIDKTENTPRGADVCFKTYMPGKGDLEVTFDIGCSSNYEGNDIIIQMAASCGDAVPKDWLFLNRPIADVNTLGYRGCFSVFNFSLANPSSGLSQISISMAPAAACLGCACPVRMVKGDGLGDIDVLSVPAQVQRLLGLSADLKALRIDPLAEMQASLPLTLSERVTIEVDDIIASMHMIGKTQQNIEADFQQIATKSDIQFYKMRQKGSTRGLIEVYKKSLDAMLGEILGSMRQFAA